MLIFTCVPPDVQRIKKGFKYCTTRMAKSMNPTMTTSMTHSTKVPSKAVSE